MSYTSPSDTFDQFDPYLDLPPIPDSAQPLFPAATKRKAGNPEDKRASKLSRGKNWNEDDSSLLITALLWNQNDKKRTHFTFFEC